MRTPPDAPLAFAQLKKRVASESEAERDGLQGVESY
jgi:hypothetical protein